MALLATTWRVSAESCLTNIIAGDMAPAGAFPLVAGGIAATLWTDTNDWAAVQRAAVDLQSDVQRVTGILPRVSSSPAENPPARISVIIGTLGKSAVIDSLVSEGKLTTNDLAGQWESFVITTVSNPMPGVDQALVVAGSDRRGTIYGIYELSEQLGVSPWYWWADVPVKTRTNAYIIPGRFASGEPAVKYRGIFLNDEDWCLRPWAAKTLDPQTGNIGQKTYAKIFELLLRLRANYLWPAMHPGTRAFNFYPADKVLADDYGIVMGSSHCEQMLRDNIDEWKSDTNGDYNFVTNPDGVLKYWEQRVRENGKYENVYTLGMRGISDSGMPGGGTTREKADRLHTIIADQRAMLAQWVNPDVTTVPQIFCPYKEVLELYRLRPDEPDDITLVWPDDNYGYVRQFSDADERKRSGGAGVYYHVSYWGAPHDYLWLCTTAPGLIAEEMTKAYDYDANKVWILNVGDLKPAELDIEYFLNLAWNPHSWDGTNTYDLLEKQLAWDFSAARAPELTSIMAEYYRLNFQRKPESMVIGLTNTFSTTLNADEARRRLEAWQKLSARAIAAGKDLPAASQDAFFELIGYPVEAAAMMNQKCLALDEYYTGTNQDRAARLDEARSAQAEIDRLTDAYNNQLAGGKWRYMMSSDPRNQLELEIPQTPSIATAIVTHQTPEAASPAQTSVSTPASGADFVEENQSVIMEAGHASAFIAGKDAHWRKIVGVGYSGEAVGVYPVSAPVIDQPETIQKDSPCLEYRMWIQHPGDWKFIVRALPTFSVEAGKPQRYAIALDDELPKIVALPYSLSESNRQWREDVLRNATLTASTHPITQVGLHTLRIWMVDPGIVVDGIAGGTGDTGDWGYLWPAETSTRKANNSPDLF
jgi:hypothetical protein